jgi:hypothetical protein
MRIAVIGCGPAGLAAAHAAVGLGTDVTVYAPKKKTPQRGPILMQRALPGINTTQPDGYIRQIVIGGSVLDYRKKLYGDVNVAINGDILAHGYPAWQVPETYDALWNLYHDLIVDITVNNRDLDDFTDMFDLVINTAPAPFFCTQRHDFIFKEIDIVQRTSYPGQPPNTIIFNAYADLSWVRSSRVFGAEITEYDLGDGPRDAMIIKKPLRHNCNCHPLVFRTGRFGNWHNETWIDSAYFDVYRIITSMQNKVEWEAIK